MSKHQAKKLALEEITALEKKIELKEGLPHLHRLKFYKWSREFFECREKEQFVVAANQIGKSTAQIAKCIEWAGNTALWPSLWPGRKPNLFFYLYPSRDLADTEFETKWKGLLPSGKYKDHPTYGWKVVKERNMVKYIQFNSGIVVHFKTYSQDVSDLQAGTCYAVFCFVAGTKVLTPLGEKNIEEIKIGDFVLGREGFEKVTQCYKNKSEVLRRETRKGSILIGTKDHPIWTENRGWVSLGNLTEKDILIRTPVWDFLKKFSYLMGFFTRVNLQTQTIVQKIILGVRKSFFMSLFGRSIIIKEFQKAMSFITRMITHSITELRIWNLCLEQNIQGITKLWNGEEKKHSLSHVKHVEKNFFLGPLKEERQDDVLKNVENSPILKLWFAFCAKNQFWLGKILLKDSVLPFVQTEESTWVYNLETEKTHTYFAEGILTHNCDEELPVNLLSELQLRLASTDGYFSMVFTATLGQDHWRCCMEPGNADEETHATAKKWNISMYDCLSYEDGSPTHWTVEKIERVKSRCGTKAEIERRVFGRFVVSGGLMFEAFDRERNTCEPFKIPPSWFIYTGVDCGSGGERGHPSAMIFLAIAPDYRRGVVFRGWRGDRISTTASDTLMKYIELRQGLKPVLQQYDWESRDFFTVASRMGETFTPAEKGRDLGKQLLNVLFKNNMLSIFRGDPELEKLIIELTSLLEATSKSTAKDDFIDALRYSVMRIPFDWTAIGTLVDSSVPVITIEQENKMTEREKMRRGLITKEERDPVEEELAFWDDLMN